MAGSFTNLSFEDPGAQPGEADAWTFSFTSSFAEFAGFDSAGEEEEVEDFEERWTGLDTWLLAHTSTASASFLTSLTPVAYEDFANLWTGVPGWSLTLVSSQLALFYEGVTDNEFEDFFAGWPADPEASGYWGLAFADFTTVSAASFDTAGTPEPREDYEELWTGLSTWSLTLGAVTAASFDSAGTPEAVEDYEELWTTGTL